MAYNNWNKKTRSRQNEWLRESSNKLNESRRLTLSRALACHYITKSRTFEVASEKCLCDNVLKKIFERFFENYF